MLCDYIIIVNYIIHLDFERSDEGINLTMMCHDK